MAQKKHEEECECEECNHQDSSKAEMFELNVLDMQLRQMEQQAMLVEQQILEQQDLISNLDELKKAKKGQSMLFPFSRDIFVEGKIESSEVLVNVGSKTLIRKSIDEAKKIVGKQKERLVKANEEIHREIEKIFLRIRELEQKLNH